VFVYVSVGGSGVIHYEPILFICVFHLRLSFYVCVCVSVNLCLSVCMLLGGSGLS